MNGPPLTEYSIPGVVSGLVNRGPWRVEALGGVRYLNLSERFSFGTSSPDLPPGPVTVFQDQDVFDAVGHEPRRDFCADQVPFDQIASQQHQR